MAPRFIARQLSRPTGLIGRIIGRLMNKTNARINAFAIRQLELAPTDRILEIGFGGGLTLPELIANASFVAGVDRSDDVVKLASARFRNEVASGRAEFRAGSVEDIPFGAATFGKVYTVNTVYFWTSLDAGFREIHRVLTPGGRAVVGFLPKQWMDRMAMPPDIFTLRTTEEVIAALRKVGFEQVRSERPEAGTAWNVIVGIRSGSRTECKAGVVRKVDFHGCDN